MSDYAYILLARLLLSIEDAAPSEPEIDPEFESKLEVRVISAEPEVIENTDSKACAKPE